MSILKQNLSVLNNLIVINKFDLNNTLKELAKSDNAALEGLFNYYYPRLYSFARSFLKLEEGIDDILQEVFIKIWQHRKEIKSPDTFNAYIFTISRNLLLNELRRKLNNEKLRNEIYAKSVGEEYLLSEKVEFNELKEKLDQLIQELPERQQNIFMLSRVEGMSNREIAKKLEISEKTVEYHISQSIKTIRRKLENFGVVSLLYLYLFL